MPDSAPRILVIRRDNIGDLVCTTPLVRALREKLPQAWLGMLVNSYNAPVIRGNPDLDAVYAYTKAKHRAPGSGPLRIYWDRLRMILRLRAMKLDYAILAAPGHQASALRFARLVRPRHIVGYADPQGVIDLALEPPSGDPLHQVESVFALGRFFGITTPPPAPVLNADPAIAARLAAALPLPQGKPLVGMHISAREADRRWPPEHFIRLGRELIVRHGCAVMLTWAPGDGGNPHFPGDDRLARDIAAAIDSPDLLVCPTPDLETLCAAISLCNLQISSDGGPVHLAAGLGKPVLCFFGRESPAKWYPWGVPHALIRKPSRQVADITVEETLDEFARLWQRSEAKDCAP